MKFIFTLITFSFFGSLQAQFEAIVSRIRDSRERSISVKPVLCGFAYNRATLIEMPPSFPDVPSVRRSLDGLHLSIKEPLYPRPLDTSLQNQVLGNPLKPCRFVIRCAVTIAPTATEPLLVVDGVPYDSFASLKQIDSSDIASVEMLKDSAASAIFGCRAARGVLLITTKSASLRSVKILDEEDRQPIPRATVRFVSLDNRDTLHFSADDSGFISVSKLNRNKRYEVTISSAGYQSLIKKINWEDIASKGEEWMLSRNYVTTQDAVISYIQCFKKRISCCILGYTRYVKHRAITAVEKNENKIKTFPNPVRPGQAITIEHHIETAEKISLQIFNAAGTAMGIWNMQANKGVNQFRFTSGQHWASGTYFFRILYANGRVAASGQIIIQ